MASISNFSPIDGASENFEATLRSSAQEAGSDLAQSGRAGVGAYFLKMTHARTAEQIERAPCLTAREDGAGCLALAHVVGLARRREEIDYLGVFAEACLV